jgi:hypothetical protein
VACHLLPLTRATLRASGAQGLWMRVFSLFDWLPDWAVLILAIVTVSVLPPAPQPSMKARRRLPGLGDTTIPKVDGLDGPPSTRFAATLR